jgi:hypothetical protein
MTKILRLGMSECTLLCIYWINVYLKKNNVYLDKNKRNLVKWLYTTSGFYDKKMKGNYFNQLLSVANSRVYNDYMHKILYIIKDCDKFEFCFHNIKYPNYMEQFKNWINPKERISIDSNVIFDFIRDKSVLFISPFAPLYKSQIDSGNCAKIHNNFPNVKNIIAYKNPYTFFNSGSHNNIFETVQYIINEISGFKDDFDCAIISCGAYSCLIADEINKWNKDVCTAGGNLQAIFGILNTRMKQHNPNILNELVNKECWIMDIPDEYKPHNYMKIEGGCYW